MALPGFAIILGFGLFVVALISLKQRRQLLDTQSNIHTNYHQPQQQYRNIRTSSRNSRNNTSDSRRTSSRNSRNNTSASSTSRNKKKEAIKEEDQMVCAICMDDIEVTLPCKHQFHSECIKTWLNEKPICPKCRATV